MNKLVTDAVNDAEILSPLARRLIDQATAMNRAILEQSGLETYVDCNGKTCYRARGAGKAQKHANYEAKRQATLRHYAWVELEAREYRTKLSAADEHDRHGDADESN